MLFAIKSYVTFLFKSTNHHGVHSPFVYLFLTKCLYQKNTVDTTLFKKNKSELLHNSNKIKASGSGEGSKKFNNKFYKVSFLAKQAGISKKREKILIKLIQYFNAKNSLEIGTSISRRTIALALGNKNGHVTTIEGCTETAAFARNKFESLKLKNITSVIGSYGTVLDKTTHGKKFDLVFFDGNHQKEATINYFNTCVKSAHNDTVFIFDNIYWSLDMKKAWDYIRNHSKVTVSIDTYKWGIVFFRKEQEKEHFIIRV